MATRKPSQTTNPDCHPGLGGFTVQEEGNPGDDHDSARECVDNCENWTYYKEEGK
jgi:hypothetical protein